MKRTYAPIQQVTQARPQDRLAAIRANNRDSRIKHVATMIANGCYRLPYRVSKMYQYDYEQSEKRRIGVWGNVARWILTGTRPTGTDYGAIGATQEAYCRVRALMMLGMTLRRAIRDAKHQATPVVLYPYRGGGYCYEGQSAYTPESFARRVMPYLTQGDRWDMFIALRLMGGGGRPDKSVDDGCCYMVSLDSSVGSCEYGPLSVMHDRQQSVELAAMGGAKVWDAFRREGFAAGMRAAA
jgi:hypothetical protein